MSYQRDPPVYRTSIRAAIIGVWTTIVGGVAAYTGGRASGLVKKTGASTTSASTFGILSAVQGTAVAVQEGGMLSVLVGSVFFLVGAMFLRLA
ncbi:MAG: hypothetical protein ABEI52_10105 [Halobacteriaceae archaeon]